MREIETRVARHYAHGALADAIRAGLETAKAGSDAGTVELLAPVDEFHIGGRSATRDLAEWLDLGPQSAVVDVGCGLGGTARFLNDTYGCAVSGVDLTPEYIEVGQALNRDLGLSGQIELSVGSALEMPYPDGRFDRATMLHVGMNIAEKDALMAEVARVTGPGALFGVYDIMLQGDRSVVYPAPWASDASTSFLEPPDTYRQALEAAGFEVLRTEDKREMALAFFEAMKARLAESGPPPLGLHILMGDDARTKVGNMHANLTAGAISPVAMLARRR